MLQAVRHKNHSFVLFLPFLFLYLAYVLMFPTTGTFGDESRYLVYAQYMMQGSLPVGYETFNLFGNGPGYSIILIPILALKLPLMAITILNALFYYFSVVYLYKGLLLITSKRIAGIVSIFWGLFVNVIQLLKYINPDILTIFLITILVYFILKYRNERSFSKQNLLISFLFAYICLTKPIFGYVLLCIILVNIVIYLINRHKKARIILWTSIIALFFTLPYLAITYTSTGKLFYWSTLAGNNLYWMSTPFEGEYGDWFKRPVNDKNLNPKHEKIFDKILINFGPGIEKAVELDDAFKKEAMNNIKQHPGKFILNIISNAGRMLFNYPYSYKLQKPEHLLRIPQTGTVVLLFLFSLVPGIKNLKKINYHFFFLLGFILFYFCGSLIGSAETRMFSLIVPPLLVWIVYILQNTVTIKIKWNPNNAQF